MAASHFNRRGFLRAAGMALPLAIQAPAQAASLAGLALRMAAAAPGGNMLVSPWDLQRAIRLLAAGAAGTTQAQLRALGAGAEAPPMTPAGVVLRQGSFLWSSPELPFSPSFASFARAEQAILNAGPAADVPGQANAWVSRLTNGMITEALRDPPATASLLLVTALAFEGRWALPFDAARTAPAPFHAAAGPPRPVRMMRAEGRFEVGPVPGGMALRLPYTVPGYAMLLVLPDPGSTPARWLTAAGDGGLESLRIPLPLVPARIGVPRMDLRAGTDMVPVLTDLGAPAPFDPRLADFSPMTGRRGPFIGAMRHQMALVLHEEGTRAAASTTITMPTGTAPRPPVDLVFDRPFLFQIESPAGTLPLFMGIIAIPGDAA